MTASQPPQTTAPTENATENAQPSSTPTTWRDVLPWEGRATRGDKALIGTLVGASALMALTIPFRPLLLASHPVLLEAVTGSLSAIGAGRRSRGSARPSCGWSSSPACSG